MVKEEFSIYLFQFKKALKIKDYIKELLFINQGVIIPGLGGFVSEYESAVFDVNENKFSPPSKKISFNTEYSYQDSLLADYIAKREEIEKEKSKKFIADFVEEVKIKLKKGDKIDFPEIGTLSQNIKGQIHFLQDIKANFLTESFGLRSVKAKQSVIHQTISKPVIQKKSYKKVLILGSSLVVFLLFVVSAWYFTNGFVDFSFFSYNNKTIEENTDNKIKEIAVKNLDSIAEADSLKALIVHSIDDNTDKKDALFYEEPKKSDSTSEEDSKSIFSKFHIIAGSFKKMENAERFATELRNKGYNPEIIQSGETLIRIAIFTYTDQTTALKELYKLRAKPEIKSVWILKSI